MKKYFKLFIFIMIIIFSPSVFAASYNVTNKINDDGTFAGVDISSGIAIPNVYHVNTRYNGVLNQIDFYINSNDWDWQYNKTYTITLTMATEDWRNHFMGPIISDCNSIGNCSSSTYTKFVNGSFRFISQKKISFNFKTGSTMLPYLKFTIYSGSGTTGMTGVTNFNLNGVTISTTTTTTPTPVPSTPTPTPAPTPTPQPNNQDIINNQTQNTQDIINNNNTNTNSIINNQTQNTQDIVDNASQNTSDIIENANSNTEQIIENNNSNMTCPVGPLEFSRDEWSDIKGKYLKNDGSEGVSSSYGISPYIIIKPNTKYKMVLNNTSTSAHYCLYSANKTLITCSPLSSSNISFTTNNNTQYLRLSLGGNRVLSLEGPVCNDWQKESMDKLKDVNQSIYNSINDDNIDNGLGGGFFSDFQDNQHGLTSIITAPLAAIERLTSSTCQPLQLPIPYTNTNVSLPCMTQVYQERIPTIYNIWKVVSFGIIAYFICIDIFHIVKGFKDPESDKVEVLDL